MGRQIASDKDVVTFVRHSEAISGITYNANRESTKRHTSIATIIAGAHKLVVPQLINCALSGKTRDWYRTGTEWASRGMIPSAESIPSYVDEWIDEVERGIASKHSCPDEVKSSFAWRMHDQLSCISPFKYGNGRTARLMHNHIRLLLGLKINLFLEENQEKYFGRLEEYRVKQFLPKLQS